MCDSVKLTVSVRQHAKFVGCSQNHVPRHFNIWMKIMQLQLLAQRGSNQNLKTLNLERVEGMFSFGVSSLNGDKEVLNVIGNLCSAAVQQNGCTHFKTKIDDSKQFESRAPETRIGCRGMWRPVSAANGGRPAQTGRRWDRLVQYRPFRHKGVRGRRAPVPPPPQAPPRRAAQWPCALPRPPDPLRSAQTARMVIAGVQSNALGRNWRRRGNEREEDNKFLPAIATSRWALCKNRH